MRLLMKESYTVDYAGFWLRLVAMIIDIAILLALNWVITGIWNVASGMPWMGGQPTATGDSNINITFAEWVVRVTVVFIIQLVYFIGLVAWRGQTLGKMTLRLKITRLDGSPVDLGSAVMRYLGYILSFFTLLGGFLWILIDNRKQGLHDKIADTYVSRIPRKPATKQVYTPDSSLPH